MARCQGITRRGAPCQLQSLPGKEYCRFHLPSETEPSTTTNKRSSDRLLYRFNRLVNKTTGRQISVVLLIVLVSAALQILFGKQLQTIIDLPNDVALQFLSSLASTVGVLVAVISALTLARMQMIEQNRSASFSSFKLRVSQLFQLYQDRPAELQYLDDAVWGFLSEISLRTVGDLPVQREAWMSWTRPIGDRCDEIYDKLSRDGRVYCRQILFLTTELAIAHDAILDQFIATIIFPSILSIVTRAVLLVASSVMSIVIFGALDPSGLLFDLRLSFVLGFIVWLLFILLDLVAVLRNLYDDLIGEWDAIRTVMQDEHEV